MNTDERAVAAVLREISTDARPVRVPDNLWVRGRRRHRLRLLAVVAGTAALLALIAAPLAWAPRSHPARPAEPQWSVPSRVRAPMPLQPNLVDAPNGPASVMVTGPGGFDAVGLSDYDDRAITIGRDGMYRYVRDINSVDAGENLLLSPDGRYLAGPADLEGVKFEGSSGPDWVSTAGVMDLTTGRVRTYREGAAVDWSPDGRLLVRAPTGQLKLLDLASGHATPLGVGGAAVAFSPDGRRLAVQQDRELKVLDLDTLTPHPVANLAARQTVAGPGAWSAGNRLAIWTGSDCAAACPASFADLRLSFVDVGSGAVTGAGFDQVRAVSARLLGWQHDGNAVVVLNMTNPNSPGPFLGAPQVLSLRPGGGQSTLLTVTADANRVDIARNLLDHFGGEPRSGWAMFLDLLGVRLPQAAPGLAVVAALVALVLAWRRFRARIWSWVDRRLGSEDDKDDEDDW